MAVTALGRGDLELLRVENDELVLVLAPALGGRLVSLQVGGSELLWRNPAWLTDDLTPTTPHADWPATDGTMGSWPNVGGSKTWPAPQGWGGPEEWAGPPDPVLDSGAYAASWTSTPEGDHVVLTSDADPRTGLRITREISVPPAGSSFTQVARLTNAGDRPVRWSAWEVTQVATGLGGEIVVDVQETVDPLELVVAEGRPRWSTAPGQVRVPVQETVAKLGFTAATGRLEWRRGDGAGLVQEVRRVAGATYPDGGCVVELWLQHPLPEPLAQFEGLHPDAHLVELETLSPLTELEPGESVALDLAWTCAPPR